MFSFLALGTCLSVPVCLYLSVCSTVDVLLPGPRYLSVPVCLYLSVCTCLSVLQWMFSFLALAQCCLAVFVLLALSDWWMLALLYSGWLWLDWDTPSSGGRRSRWVRSWVVWDYFRDYFPLTLIKTVDLDPRKNYIFGFHPHGVLVAVWTCLSLRCSGGCVDLSVSRPVCLSGVLVAGAFGNFCTESTGFSRLFPGLTSHLLMLPFWFRVPLFREYIMSGGLVSSSKSSLSHLVSRPEGGHVAVIAVGGAPESLDARPGALTLQVQKRKGFIKLALRHGAQLVPVFSFGENELFDQIKNPSGSNLRTLQVWCRALSPACLTL
ncbi:2-acylglycerol O-acyltransferase 2-B isoform X1 [Pleuronectes platessa]|uniref:2-acylglycerol O-acyltransferase 2-B isoform X1 n=1 Tax=Pleuronectes platessa TaxID=8262 RepID=UPI00232A2A7E|nr:2-acylglycerol O-acyltransferase 2-B isoform X1 [Pleuronectes platessa]